VYIDLYQDMRPRTDGEKENINDDIVFELELIRQIEVNIDYILMLVEKYCDSNREDKSILAAIDKAVNSSMELRSKKALIDDFVARVNAPDNAGIDWRRFVLEKKEADLSVLITGEILKDGEVRRFIGAAFRDGVLKTTGTDLDKILPPVSRFGGEDRAGMKQRIIHKLTKFFEKYSGLV